MSSPLSVAAALDTKKLSPVDAGEGFTWFSRAERRHGTPAHNDFRRYDILDGTYPII
jgi:hypothetical protein